MSTSLWLNLPVSDIARSKTFFTALGWYANAPHDSTNDKATLIIGEQRTVVMLFPEETFSRFAGNEIANPSQGTEVLISIGAESKEEVDRLLQLAEDAGGTIYGKPHDEDWMYGAGFADPDGHCWNLLYMDLNKMPQS